MIVPWNPEPVMITPGPHRQLQVLRRAVLRCIGNIFRRRVAFVADPQVAVKLVNGPHRGRCFEAAETVRLTTLAWAVVDHCHPRLHAADQYRRDKLWRLRIEREHHTEVPF